MSLSLTSSAATHLNEMLRVRGSGLGIRLVLTRSGCAGLRYGFEYVDTVREQDLCFSQDGVSLFLASEHLPYVKGMVLDYVREGLTERFLFLNPCAKGSCGCGKSFTA